MPQHKSSNAQLLAYGSRSTFEHGGEFVLNLALVMMET